MTSSCENWICTQNKNLKNNLTQNINCSPILLQLLANRNISTEEEIESFLNPSIKILKSPSLLPNISAAVERLKKAIKKRESVLIFGDYDTDGIISSVLIYNFLRKSGLNPDIYIPDRFDEGYDISIDFIKKKVIGTDTESATKYSLIICVDCGTNSKEVKDFILKHKKSRIDVIVCDHHELNEPDNNKIKPEYKERSLNQYIIINPKLPGSKYPFVNLSAAGVTFKFIFAAYRELDNNIKERFGENYISSMLDLVAISTIADLMPLINENRAIVCLGLKMLGQTKNPGLKILLDRFLGDRKNITAYDIGFIIAPRLNAAGRIKNAMDSVEILKEECDEKERNEGLENISGIIDSLDSFNTKRQSIQREILKEILESEEDLEKVVSTQRIYVGKSAEWNEGVLGVVAADLVKKLNIPVILFKEDKGRLKGSGRSVENFDLHKNVSLLKEYFIKFGGHRQACGITMDTDKYEIFKKEIIGISQNNIKDTDLKKSFHYDMELDFSAISKELTAELKKLEPFGIGNPKPVFLTGNCLIQDLKELRNGKHLSMSLKNAGFSFKAILFNTDSEKRKIIGIGSFIDILFNIEENDWDGRKETRLIIVTFKKHSS